MNAQHIKVDASFIGKIQRRQKRQTRRAVRFSKLSDKRRVMRPCAYRELETYQLVSVEDRPFEWDALTSVERLAYLKRGAREGSTVYKTVATEVTGEFLRIVRTRTEAMIDISDEDLLAEGFEEREEYLEYMGAVYGEHVETVWVIEFEWTHDGTLFLARQNGYAYPEQYTARIGQAVDDAPAVDPEVLKDAAIKNRERFQQFRRDETGWLEARLKDARRRAGLGIDVTLEIAHLRRQLDEKRAA